MVAGSCDNVMYLRTTPHPIKEAQIQQGRCHSSPDLNLLSALQMGAEGQGAQG
jgi:hypothetical protein